LVQAFTSVYVTGASWGQYCQTCNTGVTSGTVTLTVTFGAQSLQELCLAIMATACTALIGSISIPCTVTASGTGCVVKFTSAVTVTAGQALVLTLSA
jgi:hypothetical protein